MTEPKPHARRVLEPFAGLPAEALIEPAETDLLVKAVAPAGRLGPGDELLGDLGPLLGHRATVAVDQCALLRHLSDAGLAARGGLRAAPFGQLLVDPLLQAVLDPVVAEIEDVVDPFAQLLDVVAVAMHGRHPDRLDLLLQPVAGAVAVVAAELDVGAAAGHVGRDGHGAGNAGLGDDMRFLLVVARIEHQVRNGVAAAPAAEVLQVVADIDEMLLRARPPCRP